MDRRKILLLIFDGLGDRPVAELGHTTPPEAAPKPALVGYDPDGVYTGGGPFEAAGVGITLEPGDIAFRCNFVTVDEDMKVLDRRAGGGRGGGGGGPGGG